MSKIDLGNLDSMQYDVLKELGNIGAGNATTALSKLINAKIDMRVPKVNLLGFSELAKAMGREEEIMVGILLLLEGDVDGMMMFLLDVASARALVNSLMGKAEEEANDDINFDEMEFSALREIGNIITGSYLSALSDMTRLTIVSSVPSLQIDMAEAILSIPAIEFSKIGDKVLLIQTQFDDDSQISGYFVLVPELDSYDKILSSLGL
ncbi:MAG: chemotaxis protein CheC [Lachnospiraceae bacterium]|nr:chemotaxis protein CheC [Lachnospiraceae bacterium]MEE0685885.1 chemotaxis protein CheC [Lachnospiraceae bacterium]MEE0862177.1 chemotaxis protein CheC [Lachnospiraceae bacterium]